MILTLARVRSLEVGKEPEWRNLETLVKERRRMQYEVTEMVHQKNILTEVPLLRSEPSSFRVNSWTVPITFPFPRPV